MTMMLDETRRRRGCWERRPEPKADGRCPRRVPRPPWPRRARWASPRPANRPTGADRSCRRSPLSGRHPMSWENPRRVVHPMDRTPGAGQRVRHRTVDPGSRERGVGRQDETRVIRYVHRQGHPAPAARLSADGPARHRGAGRWAPGPWGVGRWGVGRAADRCAGRVVVPGDAGERRYRDSPRRCRSRPRGRSCRGYSCRGWLRVPGGSLSAPAGVRAQPGGSDPSAVAEWRQILNSVVAEAK